MTHAITDTELLPQAEAELLSMSVEDVVRQASDGTISGGCHTLVSRDEDLLVIHRQCGRPVLRVRGDHSGSTSYRWQRCYELSSARGGHVMTIWHPKTVVEAEAGRELYGALVQLPTDEQVTDDPEAALRTLEYLGRVCVRILGTSYTDDPEHVSLTDLVRSLAPTLAPIVARWAGTDPKDVSALTELPHDLTELWQRSHAIREQLASGVVGFADYNSFAVDDVRHDYGTAASPQCA